MAQQSLNYGTVANDGTGNPLRDAMIKVDDNFDELYAYIATLEAAVIVPYGGYGMAANATATTIAGIPFYRESNSIYTHDVSGTDSPYRETSNIYDGSRFTADMAIQNVIGDSFRGATWVSIHNGGGVGWGEVINGGFGMLIDGSADSDRKLKSMLFWDVNNGISRRSWARNKEANFAIKRAMKMNPDLKVTMPNSADDSLINSLDL